jgi:hypothetical protein
LCAAVLKQPDRHAALIFLAQALPSLETLAPGLRNEGLFALHELTQDIPKRPEWNEHKARARAALGEEGRELLQKLGFTIDRLDNLTLLLKGADRRLALAILLDESEVPEAGSARFSNLSPVSYAFTKNGRSACPSRLSASTGKRLICSTCTRLSAIWAKPAGLK